MGNLREISDDFESQGFIYSPNSIYHGGSKQGMGQITLLKIENARLTDFIEFLFEHSEHCDHISQEDAWIEFMEYELKDK